MKISRWGKKAGNGTPGIMVRVTYLEAAQLIQSLSSQLTSKPIGGGRLESTAEDGSYFSVAVVEDHPAGLENGRLRAELAEANTAWYENRFSIATEDDTL